MFEFTLKLDVLNLLQEGMKWLKSHLNKIEMAEAFYHLPKEEGKNINKLEVAIDAYSSIKTQPVTIQRKNCR